LVNVGRDFSTTGCNQDSELTNLLALGTTFGLLGALTSVSSKGFGIDRHLPTIVRHLVLYSELFQEKLGFSLH